MHHEKESRIPGYGPGQDWLADIVRASATFPERPAIVLGEDTWTYRRLAAETSRILRAVKEDENDTIGIPAHCCLKTYAAILAVLLSGKTYVILHPAHPEERNRNIARQAGLKGIPSGYPGDGRPEKDTDTGGGLPLPIPSALPAYLIFTSGSTGEPKGVPISRDNLNAFYAAYRQLGWEADEHDRMLQMFELTFDVSVVSFLYPLTLGACLYPVPPGGIRHLAVLDLLERNRLTCATVAPSVLRLCRPYFPEIRLPHLRWLGVTAEASETSLLEAFRPCIPEARIVNLYGPTEATIYCTAYLLPGQDVKQHNGIVAIGRPFAGTEIRIADEQGRSLPAGEAGELWVSGPQVMSGYWNDPEKTAGVLVRTEDGKVFYRTGDLCRADADGDLLYCGRIDKQIKVQGFRIEPGEIEYRAREYFGHECQAIAFADTGPGGNPELHLVAECSPRDPEPLKQFLQRHLPPYMIPALIHFLPVFPRNASDKTDRKAVRELFSKQQ